MRAWNESRDRETGNAMLPSCWRWCIALILLKACASMGSSSEHTHAALDDHAGCGHSQVLDTEQRLITKSLYLRAVANAKESMQVYSSSSSRTAATAAQTQLPPAAPRVHLSYQLAGFAGSPALSSTIASSLMPTAVRVLQKLFQVASPTPGNLLLPPGWGSSKCIDADVDPQFIAGKGAGRPVDYVLYVTSVACLPGTMAYAGVCAVGGPDNRPIMGAINLCPVGFELLPAKRQMETVIHELLHAFVFSPSLFPLFRSGDPRRIMSGAYGPTTSVTSPSVVAALRRLSGCGTAGGAPLEDEGSGGSRGSHWEARLFQGELMLAAAPFAGRSDKPPRLDLTAALLQDSGWYLPRWQLMPPLDFGAGAGCAWLSSAAKSWMSGQPRQRLYCSPKVEAAAATGTNGTTCSYDHLAVAECFKGAKDGSSAPTNFLNGVSFPYALSGISNCLSSSKPPAWWSSLGAWRGPTALCYPVAQHITDISGKRYTAGASCWDTTCGEGGQLYVTLRFPGGVNNLLRCPTGKTLDLAQALPKRFMSGVLECPDNAKVCAAAADSCGSCVHGYCQAGRCHCALEYVGPACDVHVADVEDMDAWLAAQGFSGGGSSNSLTAAQGVDGPGLMQSSFTAMAGFKAAGSGSGAADVGGTAVGAAGSSLIKVQPISPGLELPRNIATTASGSSSSTASQPVLAAATAPLVSSSVYSSASVSTSSKQVVSGGSDATAALLFAKMQQPAPSSVAAAAAPSAAPQRLDALLASLTTPSPDGALLVVPAVEATVDHQQQLLEQLMQGGLGTAGPSSMAAQQTVAAAPAPAAKPVVASSPLKPAAVKKPAAPLQGGSPPPKASKNTSLQGAASSSEWISVISVKLT